MLVIVHRIIRHEYQLRQLAHLHTLVDSSFKETLCLLEMLGDIFRGVAALKRCDINLAVGQIACQLTA